MQQFKKKMTSASIWLAIFLLWTLAVCHVDVQAIGPQGTCVGFATLNRYIHNLVGVHWELYTVTDWLGLVPLVVCTGFGIIGLYQLIKRKHLFQVNRSILILGGFYLVVMAAFIFFEVVAINHRPVLVNGRLEASYPSSTTMLVMCVMPTAWTQIKSRVANRGRKCVVFILTSSFIAFMVIGRLLSGVHWFTDIIGGVILSIGLVTMHDGFITYFTTKSK